MGSEAHWDSITQGLRDTVLINYNNHRDITSDLTRPWPKARRISIISIISIIPIISIISIIRIMRIISIIGIIRANLV